MRFTVEERHLTDMSGRPVASPAPVQFHSCEGETLDEAVRLFVRDAEAELIGEVLKFPGFQAVATVRKASGVYTLQFSPASERNLKT
jgi:hypothetical protein